MASKAYVVAMTVSELKEELKQRGMSTKGSKRDLRDRLEQVSTVCVNIVALKYTYHPLKASYT